MQCIHTYYPLYHDVIRTVPPVDTDIHHHISRTLLSTSPIRKSIIQSDQSYNSCGNQKTIQFTIPSFDSSSTLSPHSVIHQTFHFHCTPIKILTKKHYPRPIQELLPYVIHNNNIHYPLVQHIDLVQPIFPTPSTPPMICLTTIKTRLDPTETNVPFISPFHLRCGYIRSIQVTPPRIHTK